ncbi:hypothetical protein BGX26_011931, partial [Mortierella sp. AD094]
EEDKEEEDKEEEDKEEEDKEEEDEEIEEKKRNRFSDSHFEIILDFLERPGKYHEVSNIGKRGSGGKAREWAFAKLTEYFKERIRRKLALSKSLSNDHASNPQADDVSFVDANDVSSEEEDLVRYTAAAYPLAAEDPDEDYILLPKVGSSSQESKKKGKEKAARHWTETQSAGEEDEFNHEDEVEDDALEYEDQDDALIPEIGPSR